MPNVAQNVAPNVASKDLGLIYCPHCRKSYKLRKCYKTHLEMKHSDKTDDSAKIKYVKKMIQNVAKDLKSNIKATELNTGRVDIINRLNESDRSIIKAQGKDRAKLVHILCLFGFDEQNYPLKADVPPGTNVNSIIYLKCMEMIQEVDPTFDLTLIVKVISYPTDLVEIHLSDVLQYNLLFNKMDDYCLTQVGKHVKKSYQPITAVRLAILTCFAKMICDKKKNLVCEPACDDFVPVLIFHKTKTESNEKYSYQLNYRQVCENYITLMKREFFDDALTIAHQLGFVTPKSLRKFVIWKC